MKVLFTFRKHDNNQLTKHTHLCAQFADILIINQRISYITENNVKTKENIILNQCKTSAVCYTEEISH